MVDRIISACAAHLDEAVAVADRIVNEASPSAPDLESPTFLQEQFQRVCFALLIRQTNLGRLVRGIDPTLYAEAHVPLRAMHEPASGVSAPQDRISHKSTYRTWSRVGGLNLLHS